MKYLLLGLLFLNFTANSQLIVNELQISENSKKWFDTEIGIDRNEISVGLGEEIKILSKTNSPYYNGTKWSNGNISYRGQVFQDVQLLLDLSNDHLIAKNNSSLYPYRLNKNQVEWFVINDVLFERHEFSKIGGSKDSFLEVVHQGERMNLYLHSSKQLKFKEGIGKYYDNRLIIIKSQEDGAYYPIKNKRSVKLLFPEDKKHLKSFFRKERIVFIQRASKNTLEELSKYCNQL